MVLKATSIHTNFVRPGEQFQDKPTTTTTTTQDATNNDITSVTSIHEAKDKGPEDPNENNIILVVWDGEDDPENPMNWSLTRKWITTAMLCAMCLFIGLATAAFSTGIGPMVEELGTSVEIGQVGMLLFNGAFAIVPLVLGPLSEFTGRNPVYLISYALFTVWFIPLALAKNIGTILVSRFLSGACGAAGCTIVPGTLSDIWQTKDRGVPVALFSLVAVGGTIGAPLYCGYILEGKGWRWIQWVQLIVNGAVLLVELLLLKETRGSLLLTRKAKKLRKQTGDERFRAAAELEAPSLKQLLKASTTRAAMLIVKEPTVLFFSIYIAYAWALIFAFFSGIPIVFQEIHGWSVGNGGLAYIGPVLGCLIAFAWSFHGKYLYDRARERNNGVPVPEARLYYAAVGGILATVGMFIFAWTHFGYLPWIAPEIALVPLIIGVYQIFEAVQQYLADAYGAEYGASAISAQGFIRNSLAASFPLFSAQMFHNLGVQWAGTMLALLLALAVPLPFILIKYGAVIRSRSKYAASDDVDDANNPVMGARRSKRDVERGEKKQQPSSAPLATETPTTASATAPVPASGNDTAVSDVSSDLREKDSISAERV